MRKNKASFAGFILFVLVASGLFITCDIGLGNSVDTKPPTVSITYPPVESVIKNTFTMKGAATDETLLHSVSVQLTNTVTAAAYGPYSATLDTINKTWTLVVNNHTGTSTYEIPDGTYQITATATDGASRKSVATTTYEIDNTPPVLVLERPGTYGPIAGTTPEIYGTELKVTGSANDDHAIEKLVFTVYDSTGTQVGAPISMSNISGVGMDITLAKYYASTPSTAEEINLDALYRGIYSTATGGTQVFYFTADVSDNAREFNPPAAVASATNVRGNTSAFYFVYDDIYKSIFSASGYAVSMKDLTSMYNGSYSDKTKSASVISALAAFKRSTLAWSTAAGTFSLNPANSPSYTVLGFDPISVSNPITSIKKSNATDLSIQISAGRDAIPLSPDTFRIYLDPCDDSCVPLDVTAADDVVLLKTIAELGTDTAAISARNLLLTKSGTDYSVFVNIGSRDTTKKYLVKVEGQDQNGNQLDIGSKQYGFRVVTNGKPPVVTITSPSSLANLNNNSVTAAGTVSSDTGLTSLSSTITVMRTSDSAVVHTYSGVVTTTAGNWTLPIDTLTYTTATGTYQFTCDFTALDQEGNTTLASRVFYIDHEVPAVEITSISPTVTVGSTDYINGIVAIKGRVTDNDMVASASYTLNGGTPVAITNFSNWTISGIDTRNYDNVVTGLGTLTLEITVTDRSGNTTVVSKPYPIDQSTDNPVVSLTNASASVVLPAGVTSTVNLFDTSSNSKILGTVSDDDGIASVEISVDGGTFAAVTSSPTAGSTTGLFQYALPGTIAEGYHTINIRVTDNQLAKQTSTGTFYIAVDNSNPALAITSPTTGLCTNATFNITGTASDSSGLLAGEITIKNGASVVATPAVTGGNWSYAVPVDTIAHANDGTFTYTVVATDVFGKQTSSSVSFTIDTIKPVPVITNPGSGSWQSGSSYTTNGTAADTGGSGVSKVEYSTDNVSWTQASGTNNWNASLNLIALGEGNKTLYVRATDAAGNFASSSVSFGIDQSAPVITETAINTTDVTYKSAVYTLSGQASDTDAIASISVTENGVSVLNQVVSGTSQTWTTGNLPLGGVADGTYAYSIVLTDIAGKTSTLSRTIKIDTTKPTCTILNPTASSWYNGTAYTINGTAADSGAGASGVASVEYSLTSATGPWTTASGTTSWNANITLVPEGYKTLYVRATDAAGNVVQTVQSVAFGADLNPPNLTETQIGVSAVNKTATFFLAGVASDTNALESSSPLTVSVNGGAASSVPVSPGTGAWSYSVTVDTSGHTNDGTYAYVFTATDIAGKTTTITRNVTIDTTAATLSVNAPSASSWVQGTSSPISITADDGTGTGVSEVRYFIDAASVDHSGDTYTTWTPAAKVGGYWTATFNPTSIGEGYKKLWVKSKDVAGNINTTATTGLFGVDLNVPILTETAVGAGTVYRTANFALSGAGTDTNAAAAPTLTVSVDGGSATAVPISSGTWTYNVNAASAGDGNHSYIFTITDVAGKTVQLTRSVTIDTGIPTVVINAPSAASWISGSSYTVNLTADDGTGTGVAGTYFKIDDATIDHSADVYTSWTLATKSGANWVGTINPTSMTQGNKKIWAKAVDKAGNVTLTSVTALFGVDVDPPVLTETGGAPASESQNFSFSGAATDSNPAAVPTLTVSVDSGTASPVTISSGTWSYSITAASAGDGTHTYAFKLTDVAGNAVTINKTVVIDTTVPAIAFNNIVVGQTTNLLDASPKILGSITDASGIASMSATIEYSSNNGTSWSTLESAVSMGATASAKSVSFSKDLSTAVFASDGLYRITVQSSDIMSPANAATSATVQFRLDRTSPAVTLSAPSNNGVFNQSFTVTGTATSPNLGSVQYQIDSGSMNTLTGPFVPGTPYAISFVYDPTSLSEGTHTLTLQASTLGTRVGSQTLTFSVDKTAPVNSFNNISGSGGTVLQGSDPQLLGTVTDTSGVALVERKIEYWTGASWIVSSDWTSMGTPANAKSFSWSQDLGSTGLNLADGQYRVAIRTTDMTLPVNTATGAAVLFYIDRASPSLTITAPASGASVNQGFSMSGTSSDANLVSVQGKIDSGSLTATSGTNSWSYALTTAAVAALTEGSHTITIVATDIAGNTTTQTLTFFRDTTAPTVTVNTLNTNTGLTASVLQDTLPILSGTVTDAVSLGSWNYRIEQWTDTTNWAGTTWTVGTTSSLAKDWLATPIAVSGTTSPWSVDLTTVLGTLNDGRYRILLHATDATAPSPNISADLVREFWVDRSAPALAITSPATQGTYWNASTTVTGTASDASGVATVKLKFDSNDFTSGVLATVVPSAGSWSTSVDISSVTNGAHVLWVQAADNTGKTSLQSVSVNIDKVAPTIVVNSHTNGSQVTGQVTIGGTASDNSQLKTVKYRFGKNATTWTDMPNSALYSWSYTFTDVSTYANATYATQIDPGTKAASSTSNIWLLPFEIQATDMADNVTEYSVTSPESGNKFYLMLDPSGDLPVTNIFYPVDNATVGGTVRVYGSATDNTWVKSLTYEISTDGGATWTAGTSGAAAGTTASATISGSAGASVNWYANINTDGYLTPASGTRTAQFRIWSTDSKDYGATAGVAGTKKTINIVFNANMPVIQDVKIDPDTNHSSGNEVAVGSGAAASGTFYVLATVKTPVGLTDLQRKEEGPLTGTASILNDGLGTVAMPTLKTAGSFISGRKYIIQTLGTDYTLIGATANTVGLLFTASGVGSGSGTAYEADSSGYFNYGVALKIDSTSLGSGIFASTSGSYAFDLVATDLTTPNPYVAQSLITLQLDNYYPTGAITSSSNMVGSSFNIQGTATDVGSGSGTVASVSKVVTYIERSGALLNLQTGSGTSGGTTLAVKNMANAGAIESVLYPAAETAGVSHSYYATIDSFTERGISDSTGSGGNGDGFLESIILSGNTYSWWAQLDSSKLADGPATIHYVIFDAAGNATHYTQSIFIANNAPAITGVTIGTDAYGDGLVNETGDQTTYTPSQFAATGFTAQNKRLYFKINSTGGNGQLFYSIKYPNSSGTELIPTKQPGSLTAGRLYRIAVPGSTSWTGLGAANNVADTIFVASGTGIAAAGDGYSYELSSSGSVVATTVTTGGMYYIASLGSVFTGFGAASNTVGTIFTATATGTGTGTVIQINTLPSSVTGDVVIANFTAPVTIADSTVANDKSFYIRVYDSTPGTSPGVNSLETSGTVNLTVKNTDTVVPTVTMNALYWNSASDNSIYQQSAANGHLDLTAAAKWASGTATTIADSDPKISGKVSFTGTMGDDQRIQYVRMRITDGTAASATNGGFDFAGGSNYGGWYIVAQWDSVTKKIKPVSSTLAANGWAFTVPTETLGVSGHSATWKLDFDSAKIAKGAAADLSVEIEVQDYRNAGVSAQGTANNNNTAKQIDVVPYITSVARNASLYNTNRSKYGRVPVMEGETGVVISGFNLLTTVGTNDWIKSYNAAVGGTADTNLPAVTAYGTGRSSVTFTVNAAAKSGWLRLAVNGIEAINAENDNSLAYNKADDGTGLTTTKWFDDVYLSVWNVDRWANGNAFASSTNAQYPTFAVTSAGALVGSWINYANATVTYNTIDGTAGTAGTATNVFKLYDPPEFTDISIDQANDQYTIGYIQNTYGGSGGWTNLNSGSVNVWTADITTGNNNTLWQPSINGNGTFYGFITDGLWHNSMLWEDYGVKVVRKGNAIHEVWYDDSSKSIKYAYYPSTLNTARGGSNPNYYNAEVAWINIDGGSDAADTLKVTSFGSLSRVASVGASVSLDVDKNGYPVISYYDNVNHVLRVAYATSTTPNAIANWHVQAVHPSADTYDSYAGANSSDKNGNITIKFNRTTGDAYLVAYRPSKGQLVYMTAGDHGTGDFSFSASSILDSNGNVGSWSDISVNHSTNKPVMVYQNKSMLGTYDGLKVAYWDATLKDQTGASVTDWETMIAPSNNFVSDGKLSVACNISTAGTAYTSVPWTIAVGFKSDMFRTMFLQPTN